MTGQATNLQFDYTKYGFRNEENYLFKAPAGLNERRELPMEYAVELNRLIQMEMEGSVG